MGIFSKKADDNAQRYELNNKVLICHHCENDPFLQGKNNYIPQ